MKKILTGVLFLLSFVTTTYSQEFSYGLKGGINYSMGGQITGENSGAGYWYETLEGTPAIGYHGGAFVQVNFGRFFIRPEVEYVSLELDFEFPKKTSTYSVQKFNVPLMVGFNIWGPMDIYAGPAYSNILESSLMGNESDDPIVAQNTPINAQAGAKFEFGRFGIDLRYEHSLSTAEVQNIDIINDEYGVNRAYFEDSRINQFIVSVIFKLGGPGLNEGRRRACY